MCRNLELGLNEYVIDQAQTLHLISRDCAEEFQNAVLL